MKWPWKNKLQGFCGGCSNALLHTFLALSWIYSFLKFYLLIFYSNYKMLIFETNYFLFNSWYLCYILCSPFHGKGKRALKKKTLKKLCSCVWMSYMNIMWVQVPLEARRRHWIPWNWRNRQLWAATCGCWELNLCKSSKCS